MLTVFICTVALCHIRGISTDGEGKSDTRPGSLCCPKDDHKGHVAKGVIAGSDRNTDASEREEEQAYYKMADAESSRTAQCRPCYENESLSDTDMFDLKTPLYSQNSKGNDYLKNAGKIDSRREPSLLNSWADSGGVFPTDAGRQSMTTPKSAPTPWAAFTKGRHRGRRSQGHHRTRKRPRSQEEKQAALIPVLKPRKEFTPGAADPTMAKGPHKSPNITPKPVLSFGFLKQNGSRRSKESIHELVPVTQEEQQKTGDQTAGQGKLISKKTEWTAVSLSDEWCSVVRNQYQGNRIITLNCSNLNLTSVPTNVRFKIPNSDSVTKCKTKQPVLQKLTLTGCRQEMTMAAHGGGPSVK
ncbi:hypothetical protein Btru_064371 [Bulinus truncatus]|nr:hypothetical protein Btru_064371 [Bulinus truncatus]